MGQLVAIDTLLRDARLWRGQPVLVPEINSRATGHAALDASLPGGGWPAAALVEILFASDGLGELSLLLPTLAALSSQAKPIVLVAPPYLPYAPAWQNAGLRLAQLQVIEANASDALWAMEQALRSGCCGAVLAWPTKADDKSLRRLQVAAETGQTLGFAFRPIAAQSNSSPAPLRLVLKSSGDAPQLRMIKCRGALPPATAIAFAAHAQH